MRLHDVHARRPVRLHPPSSDEGGLSYARSGNGWRVSRVPACRTLPAFRSYHERGLSRRFVLRRRPRAAIVSRVSSQCLGQYLVQAVNALAETRATVVYCEIGFNGGHSAAAALQANPAITVHAFDLGGRMYSEGNTQFLQVGLVCSHLCAPRAAAFAPNHAVVLGFTTHAQLHSVQLCYNSVQLYA